MTATLDHTGRLHALAYDLDGRLVLPHDSEWDTARTAWNLAVDQQPVAVAIAGSDRDAATVMTAARDAGLRVAAQSTGHNASPLGDLSGTILLRMSELRDVQIDPVARIARVEAGAWWQDVTDAAAPHGLAALAGSAPDVGVAGYVLGGGISWLARSHGLAANTVLALDVVTADGDHRRVDAHRDPELFWALRGGGGSFGIVTAFELQLFALTEVQAGVLFFPVDRAREVLHAWHEWLPAVPDAVTTVGRILNFPPLPELPPTLAGKSFCVVELASQLTAEETDALLAPLRALGPELDTVHPTPAYELSQLHMDPPAPVPGVGHGAMVDRLDRAAIDALVDAALGAGPLLLSIELRQLGGAVARRPAGGGAVSGFDAAAALFAVGVAPTPEVAALVHTAVDGVLTAMTPWTQGCYLNFAERTMSGDDLFGAQTHARLRRAKFAYDPDDRIRSNHPVTPAGLPTGGRTS